MLKPKKSYKPVVQKPSDAKVIVKKSDHDQLKAQIEALQKEARVNYCTTRETIKKYFSTPTFFWVKKVKGTYGKIE